MAEPGSKDAEPADAPAAANDAEPSETGGEVLLEEAREEVARLVTHPVAELKRLEHVADEGESAATPLIVGLGLIVVFAVVFVIVTAVILLVYYGS